jgi:hypothetical protein
MLRKRLWGTGLGVFAALALIAAGCGQSDTKPGQAKGTGTQVAKGGGEPGKEAKKKHDHSGWWCDEHGIPEEECSMCSAKVAAEFKKKGDWCELHDRAKSQCFICDGKLQEKYAAVYRAKYGKEPPEPEDNLPKKEGKPEAKKG